MTKKSKSIKIEFSEEPITAHSGLLLFSDLINKYKIDKAFEELPLPKSNRGKQSKVYLLAILMNFAVGGTTIADVSRLLADGTLKQILNLTEFEISALTKWLHRNSGELNKKIQLIHQNVITQIIAESGKQKLTFDIDAMMIESDKKSAQRTYKGFKGYNSLLGFIPELQLNVFESLRSGNVSPASGLLDSLKQARSILPIGVDIQELRSDSAGWQVALIDYCESTGIGYTITADMNSAIKKAILQIKEEDWTPLLDKDGKETDREYAETVYCMNKSPKAHRLIVQRKKEAQLDLCEPGRQWHYAISTNKTISAPAVIKHHNARGNAENMNKEVKYGVNLDYLPSDSLDVNKLWFTMGMIVYNLFQALKQFALPEDWRRKQIGTLRLQLIQIAGKLVSHARQFTLKLSGISHEIFSVFQSARCQLC